MATTSGTVATGISVALLSYLLREYLRNRRRLPYAPGPPGHLLVGNLFDMPRLRPCLTYQAWGDTYGPLTFLSVAGQPILVLNSYQATIDLLDKRGNIYSDRPQFHMAGLVGVDTGSVLLRFGPTWKQHRKFLQSVLNPSTVKRDYASLQEYKTHEYLQTILDNPEDFLDGIKRMTGEVVTEIAYGAHRDEEHDFVEMNEALTEMISKVLGGYLVDLLPWMKWIPVWAPGAQFKRDANRWHDQYVGTRAYLYNYVKGRKANSIPMPQSYVLHLLQEIESPSQNDEDIIASSGFALYRAGTDTTQATIKSFLLAMSLYPEIQAKAREEIDRVIGDRLPTLGDIDDLPYVTAIVLEALRWNPPVATGIPHRVMEDDTYNGYFIPAGTTIIVNVWGISQDSNLFPNPSCFDPDRYYKTQGTLDPRSFVFGFGRRICSGTHLAFRSIWIAVASVLWSFEMTPRAPRPLKMDVRDYVDLQLISNPFPFPCDFRPRSDLVKEKIAEALADNYVV